jgi:hypothetical protein
MIKQGIIITVQGPDHSGKKHLIAAMLRSLEPYGVSLSVIGGEEHLHGKNELSDQQLSEKLSKLSVLVIDQNTGKM